MRHYLSRSRIFLQEISHYNFFVWKYAITIRLFGNMSLPFDICLRCVVLYIFFLSKNRGAKPPGNENIITTNKSTEGLTSKHERKA
jgi:hypothetical protein